MSPATRLVFQLYNSILALSKKIKITKRELQSLIGKISWATQCVYGRRPHLRRLIDRLSGLHRPWHKSRITSEMRADLAWWCNFMEVFNGTTPMIDNQPGTNISTDACNIAAWCVYGNSLIYTPWTSWSRTSQLHINHKEVLAVEPAAAAWAPLWRDKRVYGHIDNQAAVAIINKGSSNNCFVMSSLRRLFWLSAVFNFRLKAVYYPGIYNKMADAVSRRHEHNGLARLYSL